MDDLRPGRNLGDHPGVRAGEIRRPPRVTVSDAADGGCSPACRGTGDRAAQGGAAGRRSALLTSPACPRGRMTHGMQGLTGGALEGGALRHLGRWPAPTVAGAVPDAPPGHPGAGPATRLSRTRAAPEVMQRDWRASPPFRAQRAARRAVRVIAVVSSWTPLGSRSIARLKSSSRSKPAPNADSALTCSEPVLRADARRSASSENAMLGPVTGSRNATHGSGGRRCTRVLPGTTLIGGSTGERMGAPLAVRAIQVLDVLRDRRRRRVR